MDSATVELIAIREAGVLDEDAREFGAREPVVLENEGAIKGMAPIPSLGRWRRLLARSLSLCKVAGLEESLRVANLILGSSFSKLITLSDSHVSAAGSC